VIRILLVDDHPIVREGLAAVLDDEPDFSIVGQAESGEQALQEVGATRPDLVVMDVRLPGISGIEACEKLVARHPGTRVLMLTSFPNSGTVVRAFSAGASGFVLKESESTVLRQAVRAVAAGETYADPRVAAKLAALASHRKRAKGPHGLTLQEMRVLEMLPRGLSNSDIGAELGITEHTVKSHIRNVKQKLKARDRAEAAAIAMKEGLA
jgi:DNA-binding NarL/FixJ family response regulator